MSSRRTSKKPILSRGPKQVAYGYTLDNVQYTQPHIITYPLRGRLGSSSASTSYHSCSNRRRISRRWWDKHFRNLKSWSSIQRFEDFWVLGANLGILLPRGLLWRRGSEFWISLGLTGCLSSLWKPRRLVLSRAGLLIMYNMYNALYEEMMKLMVVSVQQTHGRNRDERHCSQNL
jgi:hypothetical protein